MKSIFNWMLLGITALAILGRVEVLAYIPRQPELAFPVASSTQLAQSTKSSFAENDDDVMRGPEKSRMTEFAAQFLRRTSQKNNPTAKERQIFNSDNLDGSTHLVAIPMDACHELLLELESVQRAILYHCPILLDSCIPASMTRLPLLYVRAEHQNSALVTSFLADAATELARKHLFTSLDDDDLNEDSALTPDDLNEDGFLPFTLTFQSLEIDGSNNNVLNTVGLPNDSRTKRLQAFVYDLREAVNEKGWEAALPMDPHEPAMRSAGGFRPRIPFMELPKPFDDNLNRFKREDTAISDEDMGFLKAEKGGNGISPIFWCQWWDDTFARTCRLREIGVYPHTQSKSSDLSYSSFYLPYETIPLPDGTASMRKAEQKFEKYQDERMLEEQKEYERGSTSNGTDTSEKQKAEPDILMTKTRDRLEELYMGSAEKVGNVESIAEAAADSPPNRTHAAQEDDEDGGDLDLKPVTASPDDFIDDWMKNRIQNIVNSRESIKSRVPLKKEKPPVEDNPVFQAYKEGKLVPETKKRERKSRDLGPYPGNDHFVGIWRVDNSPTGFPAEESTENSSENLVLRIDGTTAGGPVLDPETKQKAAGGTWKFFHEENGDVRLRIRLVIPPQKDRILVMEGIVNRMTFNSEVPMTSKAFGIPHLEEKLKSASKNPEGDILQCDGEVFVEDAVTKKNRENIGSFSLMKLKGPLAKGDYTITIPKPTRNQD